MTPRALIPNPGGASRVFAVIGDPVAQVQTPTLINPLFARNGHDIIAVPFHVPAAHFAAAFRTFAAMPNVAGIGVTIPHKGVAAGLCDHLTPAARQVGAVNAVQRGPDGTMSGALFDGAGFLAGLGGHARLLPGASVLLVGAGGAGRAIAHALAGAGIKALSVIDPDRDAAARTVEMVNLLAHAPIAGFGTHGLDGCNVLVNASPIGLKPGQRFPVDLSGLNAGTLVADIAALARDTELLATARRAGCPTSDGHDMLAAQITLIAGFAAGGPAGQPIGPKDT